MASRSLARTVVGVLAALATLVATAGAALADHGIDVSRWQHESSLDWAKVKADGVTFAFIKATEGSSYTNPYFTADWAATAQVGIHHGAYHFARPSDGSAEAQARHFVSTVGTSTGPGELPPVLDLEVTGGLGVAALRTWTGTWLETVRELTGRTPVIYTSPQFWETSMGDSTEFSGYPLWVAHYGVSSPRVPGGWPTWTFWQTTNQGRVDGITGDVDIDEFNGTPDQLAALANLPPADAQPGKTAVRVALRAGSSTVRRGSRARLSGQVATVDGTPLPGRRVRLYRRPAGSTTWVRIATVTTSAPNGSFRRHVAPRRTVSYKAVFGGGPAHLADTSNVVRIRVR